MKFFLLYLILCLPSYSFAQKEYTSFGFSDAPQLINRQYIRDITVYPEYARLNKITGRVTVKILVNQKGDVEKIGSISGPEIFYPEVKRAAKLMKFIPFIEDGNETKIWVSVPFNFNLDKEAGMFNAEGSPLNYFQGKSFYPGSSYNAYYLTILLLISIINLYGVFFLLKFSFSYNIRKQLTASLICFRFYPHRICAKVRTN